MSEQVTQVEIIRIHWQYELYIHLVLKFCSPKDIYSDINLGPDTQSSLSSYLCICPDTIFFVLSQRIKEMFVTIPNAK